MGMNLFNENWRDYIKRGERVMIYTDIAPSVCAVTALKALICALVVLGFIGLALWLDGVNNSAFSTIMVPFFILFGVCWSVVRFLQMLALKFVLTDSGVYRIGGILTKRVKYIPYKKITDIQISRSLIERIVGVGSVGISTASGGDVVNGRQLSELNIQGVAQYKNISESIFKKIK